MNRNSDFFDPDQGKIFTKIRRKPGSATSVIKRDKLVVGQPRKIEHSLQVSETQHDGKVTPIFNNEDLIGIIYECSCGKVAQILFDFEEQTENKVVTATG